MVGVLRCRACQPACVPARAEYGDRGTYSRSPDARVPGRARAAPNAEPRRLRLLSARPLLLESVDAGDKRACGRILRTRDCARSEVRACLVWDRLRRTWQLDE